MQPSWGGGLPLLSAQGRSSFRSAPQEPGRTMGSSRGPLRPECFLFDAVKDPGRGSYQAQGGGPARCPPRLGLVGERAWAERPAPSSSSSSRLPLLCLSLAGAPLAEGASPSVWAEYAERATMIPREAEAARRGHSMQPRGLASSFPIVPGATIRPFFCSIACLLRFSYCPRASQSLQPTPSFRPMPCLRKRPTHRAGPSRTKRTRARSHSRSGSSSAAVVSPETRRRWRLAGLPSWIEPEASQSCAFARPATPRANLTGHFTHTII